MKQIIIDGVNTGAIVAGREYWRLPAFWQESARRMPLTRGSLTLPDPRGEEMQRIKKGDSATLITGYRGGESSLWSAEVSWVRPGTRHQVEVGLVGADALLSRSRFTEAWMNEPPETILQSVLSRAGAATGRLDSTGVELPRFAVSNENVWQIAEKLELSCQKAFGLDMSARALWMDDAGQAHWGDFADPGQRDIPGVLTGGNLITHNPATDAAGFGEVETFLLPGLRHSQQFRLQDMYRNVSGLFRAQKVRHQGDGNKVRTHIWYGPERSRY